MKSVLLSAFVMYVGFGIYLYAGQRSFIYFPVSAIQSGLANQLFENEGHQIRAAVLNPGRQKAVLYFGGNAESVDFNADAFTDLFSDFTVYLINYRGYGGSTGSPSEQALYSDALHVYDVVSADHGQISVIGRSLGSAVATFLAATRPVQQLVLITPFDSVASVAQAQFPIYPIEWLLEDKHDSLSRAPQITAATMILAAEKDGIIGMPHTERLVEGFNREVAFHVIAGADHNTISNYPAYHARLAEFFDQRDSEVDP